MLTTITLLSDCSARRFTLDNDALWIGSRPDQQRPAWYRDELPSADRPDLPACQLHPPVMRCCCPRSKPPPPAGTKVLLG
jgi:hypothetical protein